MKAFFSLLTLAGALFLGTPCSALTDRPNAIGKVLAAREKSEKAKDAKKPKAWRAPGKTSLGHKERTHLSARHGVWGKSDEEMGVIAYHKDGKCGAKLSKKHQKKAALLQEPELPESTAHPGAGKNPEDNTPYDIIYKDGFWPVGCFNDHVRIHKDLHSAQGSHRYKEDFSDISIVWYHETVEKEDQEKMSPKVCYEFCRTVKDMGYFGLYAGTDCYCAPYYRRGEGGEGDTCDLPCEGDMTTLCGGKSKSSIYEMHLCATTMDELNEAKAQAEEVKESAKACTEDIDAEGMQKAADTLREKGPKGFGDDTAGDHGQAASVFAGELTRMVEDCAAKEKEMDDLLGEWDTHSKFEVGRMSQRDAEDYLDKLKAALEDGVALAKVADDSKAMAHPRVNEARTASAFEQYLPVMTLVDKEKADTKTTCGGTYTQKPISGLSKEECAFACDQVLFPVKERCMGYQYFEDAEGGKLCWLFSSVETVNYYQCGEGGEKFLQTSKKARQHMKAADDLECYVKVSLMTGWAPTGTAELTGCFSTE